MQVGKTLDVTLPAALRTDSLERAGLVLLRFDWSPHLSFHRPECHRHYTSVSFGTEDINTRFIQKGCSDQTRVMFPATPRATRAWVINHYEAA